MPAEVANVAFATLPVTLAPAIALRPEPLPVKMPVLAVIFAAVTLPFTPNDVNVPTLVMLGCAFVVTVPAVVAAETVPVTLAPVIEDSAEPLPLKKLASTLPVTVNTLEARLNENALLVPEFPSLLNNTSPFEPETVILPETLPITLAKTNGAVMLPLALIVPLPNTVFAVALPIVSPVSVPTDVILG